MLCPTRELLVAAAAVMLTTLAGPALASLKIAAAFNVIEYAPQRVAAQDYYNASGGGASLTNGGVANLARDKTVDLAGNAETQALRQFASDVRSLRVVWTVCQVPYRLVASRKAGVRTLADLRGKRVGTLQGTSAGYFVERLLSTVGGLRPSDYTVVAGGACSASPCGAGTLPYMLQHGTVDAVGFWEPTAELALEALGGPDQAVVFQNRSAYREVYNLHTTADKLQDPAKRREIVAFVKALVQAQKLFASNDTSKLLPRVSSAVGVSVQLLQKVWPIHDWTGGIPSDLLDVLVAEDQYVAQTDRRTAMTRAQLSQLIDDSVMKEAMGS